MAAGVFPPVGASSQNCLNHKVSHAQPTMTQARDGRQRAQEAFLSTGLWAWLLLGLYLQTQRALHKGRLPAIVVILGVVVKIRNCV